MEGITKGQIFTAAVGCIFGIIAYVASNAINKSLQARSQIGYVVSSGVPFTNSGKTSAIYSVKAESKGDATADRAVMLVRITGASVLQTTTDCSPNVACHISSTSSDSVALSTDSLNKGEYFGLTVQASANGPLPIKPRVDVRYQGGVGREIAQDGTSTSFYLVALGSLALMIILGAYAQNSGKKIGKRIEEKTKDISTLADELARNEQTLSKKSTELEENTTRLKEETSKLQKRTEIILERVEQLAKENISEPRLVWAYIYSQFGLAQKAQVVLGPSSIPFASWFEAERLVEWARAEPNEEPVRIAKRILEAVGRLCIHGDDGKALLCLSRAKLAVRENDIPLAISLIAQARTLSESRVDNRLVVDAVLGPYAGDSPNLGTGIATLGIRDQN